MTIEIHELDITDELNRELYDKLKAENEKLKKKLDIAIHFLKKYASVNSWQDCRLYDGDDEEYVEYACYVEKGYEDAQDALKLIKELDK